MNIHLCPICGEKSFPSNYVVVVHEGNNLYPHKEHALVLKEDLGINYPLYRYDEVVVSAPVVDYNEDTSQLAPQEEVNAQSN